MKPFSHTFRVDQDVYDALTDLKYEHRERSLSDVVKRLLQWRANYACFVGIRGGGYAG